MALISNAGCAVQGLQIYAQALNIEGGCTSLSLHQNLHPSTLTDYTPWIYAIGLRTAGIRIRFFPRSSIPPSLNASVTNQNNDNHSLDPSNWGPPLADFPSTHCSIVDHFRNQSIIANIDLLDHGLGNKACILSKMDARALVRV